MAQSSCPNSPSDIDDYVVPVPVPPQVAMTDGYVDVPQGRLYYWDTGGGGAPLLLAHPATGNARSWLYQQPVFAAAGYRVIAWSRRGHSPSEGQDIRGPVGVADIDLLLKALKIDRFHGIGSAGGAGALLDYTIARPGRVRTLTVSCSLANLADPEYFALSDSLRPDPFDHLPAEVRELGPSYRAANPAGVARWVALQKIARTATLAPPRAPGRPNGPQTQWSDIEALKLPILWMTGDADLYTPPPLLREFHRRTPGSEFAVIRGSGHSAYWEQPNAFNARVLDFIRRRGG